MIKVLKFGASWCGPCRMIKPIFEKVAKEYSDVEFSDIDIDSNRNIAEEYNIAAVPTIVFEVDGVEINRVSGVIQEAKLKEIINEYI